MKFRCLFGHQWHVVSITDRHMSALSNFSSVEVRKDREDRVYLMDRVCRNCGRPSRVAVKF